MLLSCCKVGKPLVSFVLSGSSSHGNNPSCQLAARISVCVVFDQSTVYIYICLLPPDLFGFRIHIFFEAELFVSLLLLLCNSEKFHPLPLPPAMHALIIVLNTLRPRQDGRHFPDAIFKCIFFNENVWIWIKISLKFIPRGPINNIPALVQIMAWCRSGDKPLSEPMMVSVTTHICVTRPQ